MRPIDGKLCLHWPIGQKLGGTKRKTLVRDFRGISCGSFSVGYNAATCLWSKRECTLDQRILRHADLLVDYCTAVKPGDWVCVHADVAALPLVEAVIRASSTPRPPTMQLQADVFAITLKQASEAQLQWCSPAETLLSEHLDARIVIQAPSNTRGLTGVDPEKQRLHRNTKHNSTDLCAAHRRRQASLGIDCTPL